MNVESYEMVTILFVILNVIYVLNRCHYQHYLRYAYSIYYYKDTEKENGVREWAKGLTDWKLDNGVWTTYIYTKEGYGLLVFDVSEWSSSTTSCNIFWNMEACETVKKAPLFVWKFSDDDRIKAIFSFYSLNSIASFLNVLMDDNI